MVIRSEPGVRSNDGDETHEIVLKVLEGGGGAGRIWVKWGVVVTFFNRFDTSLCLLKYVFISQGFVRVSTVSVRSHRTSPSPRISKTKD